MHKNRIARDTLLLTLISFGLQGLSLLLNIFVTVRLGTAATGLTTLVYAFYSFVSIIASGNIFVCVSRFVSEEIGRDDGNPHRMFVFGMISCLFISMVTSAAVFFAAPALSEKFLKTASAAPSIRILALSLIPTAIGSCIRGYFNARRKIIPGAAANAAEFLIKAGILAFTIQFFVIPGKLHIFTAVAISLCIGEICGALIMTIALMGERISEAGKVSLHFGKYLLLSIPVIFNSYITIILSSLNEALIPLTLRQSGSTSSEALSQYGIFEAIVLPLLFFPSAVIGCMSSILVPELSRSLSAKNNKEVLRLITRAVNLTMRYSFFAATLLYAFSDGLGTMMCRESIAGKAIAALAPIVPFIYLEIVLEGVIRGLGRPGFSSINYIAEYAIRITILLVCVPLFGFRGIVLSYFFSNTICNISRFWLVSRLTGLRLHILREIIYPAAVCLLSVRIGTLPARLLIPESAGFIPEMILTGITGGIIYAFFLKLGQTPAFASKKLPPAKTLKKNSGISNI